MTDPAITRARRPFAEQVAFFLGKLGNLIPTERWDEVWGAQHNKAWMVAGAQKADLLADLAGAVEEAITEGLGIERFREQFDEIVADHGWAFRGERNWRSRVIYRTNMTTSYAGGRASQLRDPALRELAPLLMYRHNDSVSFPRPLHESWDGMALPADHPWWDTHTPPNGFGCQCYVVAVTEGQARRRGRVVDEPPNDGIQPDGTPAGVDPGWDYRPGDTDADNTREGITRRLGQFPPGIGRSLADHIGNIPTPEDAP